MRERAVRMVQEHRGEYPSLWAAVESIAPKIGCVPQTLLDGVKRDEIDKGVREGFSSGRLRKRPFASFIDELRIAGQRNAPSLQRLKPTRGHVVSFYINLIINFYYVGPKFKSMASPNFATSGFDSVWLAQIYPESCRTLVRCSEMKTAPVEPHNVGSCL
ncbi:insertion element IS401 uncharacterized 12.4 kDa protein (plasmid) [Caballeronia insecticola]|uniref:Insertion element IS401 uncharacterized 12.4 kDa protein n=1 Tax=Caballeronia insecticola TaxID=758793 RepID=A0A060PH03_9BURK|nr:insertion element IS401 uncharacterized 12.4 kDa protein [Caballeronia insecticola]